MADSKYITRGALMWCSNGSHCRRVNLIKDHNIRIDMEKMEAEDKRYPFILDTDIVVGNESLGDDVQQNISWFGVCSGCLESNEQIGLKPDERIAGKGAAKTVTGKKCAPVCKGAWDNVKEKVQVQLPDKTVGHLLTTDSFLVCSAGQGIIRFREVEQVMSDGTDYLKDKEKGRK